LTADLNRRHGGTADDQSTPAHMQIPRIARCRCLSGLLPLQLQ